MEATMPNPNGEEFKRKREWEEEDEDEDQDDDEGDDDDDQDDEDEDDKSSKSKKGGDDDDDDEDQDEEDDEEYVPIKKYKELQRASTKGTQNLIKVNKAYKDAMDHLNDVSDDPGKLVALHQKNPDASKLILDQYYNGISITQFRKEVLKENITGDEIDETTMERMYEKMIAKKESEKNERIAEKKLNTMLSELDSKTASKVSKEFKELTQGIKVHPDKIGKYFKLAYYEVVGEKISDDIETKFIKQGSPSNKKSPGKASSFKSREESAINDSLSFLEDMGVISKKK